MRKLYLLAILLTAPVIGNSQSFTLPTLYLDSLLFETSKFRGCDSVKHSQANEIEKLGIELVAKGNALKLSQNESLTLSELVTNAKQSNEILAKQFALDIKKEKKKTRKWRKIALIAIVGFVAKEGLDLMY